MSQISKILSAVVSLTIINVWLFRSSKSTLYRGGNAQNLNFAVSIVDILNELDIDKPGKTSFANECGNNQGWFWF